MTARPPRASTKSDAKGSPGKVSKRARTRGASQAERDERRPTGVPTDRYERIADDDVLEVTELPAPPAPPTPAIAARLRMLVFESAPHLAAAQAAIVGAGHAVAIGASVVDKLQFAVPEVDAMLVSMPGGEALIEAALALGGRRPVVIGVWTSSALEATRRAQAAGADLATVRPHHVERLAPVLLAASRLNDHRRTLGAPAAELVEPAAPSGGDADETGGEVDVDLDFDFDADGDAGPGGLLSAELFAQAAQRELERSRRDGRALAVALFALEVPAPPPPAALRGIVRARAGNALVHALRDGDLATELDQDRFLVVMPDCDRAAGADHTRRIISAVAAGDPVTSAGRTFPPRVIGAVTAASGDELDLPRLVRDATQLLEQAQVTGASLAVET